MNTSLLDVLHNTADVDIGAVTDDVNIHLDGTLKEPIEENGVFVGDSGRLGHVLGEVGLVVCNRHTPTAQHVARTNQQREPDTASHNHRLVEREGGPGCRVGNAELVEDDREARTILREVNRLGLGAEDRHSRSLERASQLKRRLPAEGDEHADRLLLLDDVHDVLERDRLKVQAI